MDGRDEGAPVGVAGHHLGPLGGLRLHSAQVSWVEPEPDRIWILNRSHITGSGLPDSVDPAQYPDINPYIQL